MQDNRFEQLAIVRDEMLTDPTVEGLLIWNAAKLALEDKYLYELMIDWAKEVPGENRTELMREVVNYTDEILRKMSLKK
jgi:hypothetical protein